MNLQEQLAFAVGADTARTGDDQSNESTSAVSRFRWGTVVAGDPLTIKLDGEDSSLDISPDSLVKPLQPGWRVWVQIHGTYALVIGASASYQTDYVPELQETATEALETATDAGQAADAALDEAAAATQQATEAKAEAAAATTAATEATAAADAAQQAANDAMTASQQAALDAAEAAQKAIDAAEAAMGGAATVLIQSQTPGVDNQNATTLWIDTTDGGSVPKRWDSVDNLWAVVTDGAAQAAAQQAADAKRIADEAAASAQVAQDAAEDALAAAGRVTTYYLPVEPEPDPGPLQEGDLWIDTSTAPGKLKRWDGSGWVDVTDDVLAKALQAAGDAQATADAKVRTFAQPEEPTGLLSSDAGDLWVATANGNLLHRWSGAEWVPLQDASIAAIRDTAEEAARAAADAAGLANAKGKVIIQPYTPAAEDQLEQNLWIDTTDGANTPKRWDAESDSWVVIRDSSVQAAADLAAEAKRVADDAQRAAEEAQRQASILNEELGGLRAEVAQLGARGTTVTHSTGFPTPDNITADTHVGDTWFQHEGTIAGPTIGMWNFDGVAWLPMELSQTVLGNLDAGMITSGSLSGVGIFSPGPQTTPRVEIVGSSFRTVRKDDDGTEVTGISLGGADADVLQLLDTRGQIIAGFDGSGDGTAQNMEVRGALTVNGTTLDDLLFALPRGLVARNKMASNATSNTRHFGSTELGIGEVMYDAAVGRMFRVSFYGRVNVLAPGSVTLRFRVTSALGYDTMPPSPRVSGISGTSPEWQIATLQCPQVGLYTFYMETYQGNYGGNYRVLLTAQGFGGAHGYVLANDSWPNQFSVHDVGPYLEEDDGQTNAGGGTQYQAPAAPAPTPEPVVTTPPKKTYVSEWRATSTATYREGMGSMSTSQYLLQQGAYSGTRRNSHVVFNGGAVSGETGKTIASALSGASVSKIEFYGLVKHTYASSGSTASLAPSTLSAVADVKTAPNETRVSGWKANTAKWVTLANIGTGVRSVLIGPDTSSLGEYMKFDPTTSNLRLRITYTK